MTSSPDLRRRLQRLRPTPAPPDAPPAAPRLASADQRAPRLLDEVVSGRVVANGLGEFFLIEETFPAGRAHGLGALSALAHSPALVAEVGDDRSLAGVPLDRLAFLDTETTGLAGGAGTFAFLVGVGTFEAGDFHLRQYFLRTPDEERAMLSALWTDLQACAGFVTFNGRTFDLPLLDSRFVLAARRRSQLVSRPHLDLLHPARRLWRRELESCALSSLEHNILRVIRTDEDVPGALIPGMYLDYLRTGDATEMRRVIYHNAMDILSMVVLAAHVLDRFDGPAASRSPAESLALARWHALRDRAAEAEALYRQSLAAGLSSDLGLLARAQLAALLKRADRRAEAVPLWVGWSDAAPGDPEPCIEIAKHYEWDVLDYAAALEWAQRAMLALTYQPPGWQRDAAWAEVQHRIERLRRKMDGA